MRQTTNYQLPSWDSDDRILRTDFNDLTEKTDAAIADNAAAITAEAEARATADSALDLRSGTHLIAEKQLIASNSDWSVYFNLNWGEWSSVRVLLHPVLTSGASYSVYLNGNTIASGGDYVTAASQVILLPTFDLSAPVSGLCWTPNNGLVGFCRTELFSGFNSLRYFCRNGTLEPGTVLRIWGSR